MSHFPGAIYQLIFYGGTVLGFFWMLWRWHGWYVATDDDALAGRSLWAVTGVSLLFTALWLTCGKTAFGVAVLKWAISPIVCVGFACLVRSAAPMPKAAG